MPGLEKHPRLSPPGSGWEVVRGTYVILSLWDWDLGRAETNGVSPEREGAGGGGRGFSHLPPPIYHLGQDLVRSLLSGANRLKLEFFVLMWD